MVTSGRENASTKVSHHPGRGRVTKRERDGPVRVSPLPVRLLRPRAGGKAATSTLGPFGFTIPRKGDCGGPRYYRVHLLIEPGRPWNRKFGPGVSATASLQSEDSMSWASLIVTLAVTTLVCSASPVGNAGWRAKNSKMRASRNAQVRQVRIQIRRGDEEAQCDHQGSGDGKTADG